MNFCLRLVFLLLLIPCVYAHDRVVNVYTWSEVIPQSVLAQFEQETGIKVNFSTYDSNEVLYMKQRANNNSTYDVIEPSSYFVDRMRQHDMLAKLDKSKLPNWQHLNPLVLNTPFDPHNLYSLPFAYGVTGIFMNSRVYPQGSIKKWDDLWDKKFHNQLLLLDDAREAFTMALLSLGYPVNDDNPQHIRAAYEKLKSILPNVKIFSSDTAASIMIDEDAALGMAWNSDVQRTKEESQNVQFIFPQEGFIIWVENFAIPKNAPHKENAYRFLNFMLRPEIARETALYSTYPTANLTAQKLLPKEMVQDPKIYPDKKTLQHGTFQKEISPEALALYEHYWEELKMGG